MTPKVSVITVARNEKEAEPLRKELQKQTYKDFEFIVSTSGNIPHAWNDAIARARGEILVFTETDARPLTENWLKEMVEHIEKLNRGDPQKKTVVKGIEVWPQIWDMCSTAFYKKVFDKHRFDESFDRVEDTELFARLRSDGYRGVFMPAGAVLHVRTSKLWPMLKNQFRAAYYGTKVARMYSHIDFGEGAHSDVSVFLSSEIKEILARSVHILGAIIGFIVHSITVRKK